MTTTPTTSKRQSSIVLVEWLATSMAAPGAMTTTNRVRVRAQARPAIYTAHLDNDNDHNVPELVSPSTPWTKTCRAWCRRRANDLRSATTLRSAGPYSPVSDDPWLAMTDHDGLSDRARRYRRRPQGGVEPIPLEPVSLSSSRGSFDGFAAGREAAHDAKHTRPATAFTARLRRSRSQFLDPAHHPTW